MKISIIGAGNVGASAGLLIAEKNLCDQLVLIDIVESVKGKAKDIQQASPTLDFQTELIGSTDYKEIEGSDIIINTAGFPRKEGESRDDLLKRNLDSRLLVTCTEVFCDTVLLFYCWFWWLYWHYELDIFKFKIY